MTQQQRLQNLFVPAGPVDVVLDTDAFNEIDDQFAIAYLLKSEGLHTCALYAAPFLNENSTSPEDGMERSYQEIQRLLAAFDLTAAALGQLGISRQTLMARLEKGEHKNA